MQTIISGTGNFLPELVIPNSYFSERSFHDKNGVPMSKPAAEIAQKLESITGIKERRYVPFDQDSVPLMAKASLRAIEDAGIELNDLQGIIVAHNAGNMIVGKGVYHTVPNMAALLKNTLKMTSHDCFAYDLLFGCPGWVQGLIQAHQAIQNGDAQHILVVGVEIASRLVDPHDVDSMILADGCGACVLSASDAQGGIKTYATFSHAQEDYRSIFLDDSYNSDLAGHCYFHMNGKEVYKYATTWVPKVIDKALKKANLGVGDIDMFLFHQANEKMLQAFVTNMAELYGVGTDFFDGKVPATIQFTGNTSVATIPTMLDLIMKKQLGDFEIQAGQTVLMASVGAGMHCNALIYEF